MQNDLQYDVVVIGGGPAGTTAAIASARTGAKTLLVEQNGYLGGMLTAAGTGPQMTFHAGKTQVVKGIPDEIVERLVKDGYSPGHMEDFVGYASSVTPFDVEGMKITLETMAIESGVKLLYHTVYTGCSTENKYIKTVKLYSKCGFFEVGAKVFIDASADADLATNAGVSSVFGRESDNLAQPMTMNIKVANVDREKMMDYIIENKKDMYDAIPFERIKKIKRSGMLGAYSVIKMAKHDGEFNIDRDMILCFETNNKGEYILNMSRIIKKSAINPFDLTDAEVIGRQQAHEIVAFLKKYIPAFKNCHMVSTGPNIGIRESRKINGIYKLTGEDLVSNKMFDDAIAMGGYPIDIHSPDGVTTCHKFLKPCSWYSVPYRCLITDEIDNLIVAGRCLSATHEACASVRVTPILMAISEGAGTAAALCVSQKTTVQKLNIQLLRETLHRNNAFLDEYKS